MRNNFYSKTRLRIFSLICAIAVLVVMLSYVYLIVSHPSRGKNDNASIRERGTIFDRNGKILAIQVNVYNIAVTPSAIKDLKFFADSIADVTKISAEKIESTIRNNKTDFLYLKKKLSQNECDELQRIIEQKNLHGIRLERMSSRIYPENELASQVVGFMGEDGKGLSGIEYSYQNVLKAKDASDRSVVYGDNIVLTIDSNLQYKLEEISHNAMRETQAESMMLLAADAKTGEILSYVSLPSANLNEYPRSRVEERIDRPAMMAYEPGSVFKLFSVASFIDSGLVGNNEKFLCDGVYDVPNPGGEQLRMTCLEHHGWLTPQQALEYSCNDVLFQMSERMENEDFLKRIRSFGFGEKTGIKLPGETRGSIRNPSDKFWSVRSKPTMSIGQELSVSALQMLEAMTAIANDGKPLKLTLVSKISGNDGTEKYSHKVEENPPIISPSTAKYILGCMASTAKTGTGHRAALNDLTIGVKTGTAQMNDEKTHRYSDEDFLSNCLAVFPVENPQIILYIVITKAKGETYAGRIVAPVIQEAADVIIDHLGISRGNAISATHAGTIVIPHVKTPVIDKTVPNFAGYSKSQIAPLIELPNVRIMIHGEGWVRNQDPPAGTPVTNGMQIDLFLE